MSNEDAVHRWLNEELDRWKQRAWHAEARLRLISASLRIASDDFTEEDVDNARNAADQLPLP